MFLINTSFITSKNEITLGRFCELREIIIVTDIYKMGLFSWVFISEIE